MTVYRNENRWDTSNVWFEEGEIRMYDKKRRVPEMRYIDYGLSLFRAEAFAGVQADLADVMSSLAQRGELAGYEAHERFYEIGSHVGLAELEALLSGNWNMGFVEQYLEETRNIASALPVETIERMVDLLDRVRARGGRLFILGVGGSAANASHAVNDFRKLCGFECYAPTDNVSELTARTNDEGWPTVFSEWLKGSRLGAPDGVLVFSVGGGDAERNVSANLVLALQLAKQRGATILGICGRDGGFAARVADACVVVPTVNAETRHTSRGSVSGGGLASAGKPSEAESKRDQVVRAVFLDRDGVINRPLVRDRLPYPPANLEEFEILPGVEAACRLLKEIGFVLVVATNQPDVGRGTVRRETVEEIHRSMCGAAVDRSRGSLLRRRRRGVGVPQAKTRHVAQGGGGNGNRSGGKLDDR